MNYKDFQPPPGIWEALGISTLVGYLVYNPSMATKEADASWSALIAGIFVTPFVTLLFGYIFHLLCR